MPLLTDAQRAVLANIEAAKRNLENKVQRLNDLLREIERRDADSTAMNPTSETATDLITRARDRYEVLRQAAVDAANGLPVP